MAKRNYLGKTEQKVILQLSKTPRINITLIQEKLGIKNHSAVAKAVYNLTKKELIISIGSYRIKGRNVKLWGLTPSGVGSAFDLDADIIQTITNYVQLHITFQFFNRMNLILTKVAGEKWGHTTVLKPMLKSLVALEGFSENVQLMTGATIFLEWATENLTQKEAIKMRKLMYEDEIIKKIIEQNIKSIEEIVVFPPSDSR